MEAQLDHIEKQNLKSRFKGDKTIWLIVLLLFVISLLAVYSSTGTLAYKYQDGFTEYYLLKHFILSGSGIGIMFLTHLLNYRIFSRLSLLAFYISIPMLFFTLFFGSNINDASRWITLPLVNLSFQTSDFAKLALILYIARFMAKGQENIKDFKKTFLPLVLSIGLSCMLILPANFSTAAVLFATCMLILFIGRINLKYLLAVGFSMVVVLSLFFLLIFKTDISFARIPTWRARIEAFVNNDGVEAYQTQHSKIAIANGGFIGKGPGNSSERNFLPHPYSDFIYSIIIEEYGLLGGAFVLFLYLGLLYRCIKVFKTSHTVFGAFLAIGLGFSLVIQAMVNMAVAVDLFPVTGQTLPLISMGGTSFWFTGLALGIILSVSRDKYETDLMQNEENVIVA